LSQRVGILAYGSLIDEPGEEIAAARLSTLKDEITTPFKIEFARASLRRNGGPTLVPVTSGGACSQARIHLVALSVDETADTLWRRETGLKGVYSPPTEIGPNTVIVDQLVNFHGVDVVLYTRILPNIDPLTPEKLAQLAIISAKTRHDKRDGISYLIAAIRNGTRTPLQAEYAQQINEQMNCANLEESYGKIRDAVV
jgi:cation transport regulator ChaC